MQEDKQGLAIRNLMQDKTQWEQIHQWMKDYLYSQTNFNNSADTMIAIKNMIEAFKARGESYGQE